MQLNKVAVSVLALALIASVSGCVSKSEHETVLQAKATADKRCVMLTKENKGLRDKASMLEQVKKELARVTSENTRLKDEVSKLKKAKDTLAQELQAAKTNEQVEQVGRS